MTPFAVPCDGKLPLPFWQVSEIVLLFLQNSRMAPQTPEFLAESGDFKHLPRSTVQLEDETEAALRRRLDESNHLTLVECRDRLAAATGVRVDPWTIGRALRRLDWT